MATPAQMTIDQATLAAGTPGESRSDGVISQLVTVTLDPTSVAEANGAITDGNSPRYDLEVLSISPANRTVPTITRTGARTWTFTPNSTQEGSTLRIRGIVDGGTTDEQQTIRTFAIRTPNQSLRVPAPNELADPTTTLQDMGSDKVGASETNENNSPWGWHSALDQLYRTVDCLLGHMSMNEDVTGTTPTVVGAVYLETGAYEAPRAYLGTQSGSDEPTLEIYDEGAAAVRATITGPSSLGGATGTAFSVENTGWHTIRLYADVGGATAQCRGLQLRKANS